jgi:thioredoxin 2
MTVTTSGVMAIVPCAACGKLNRVDLARTDAKPTCGTCQAALVLDAPIALTDANFDQVVNSSAVPVIVDFYADWCVPCKRMAPAFATLAQNHRGRALVAKVDTEHSPLVAARFNVRSIPTIAVMRDGKEVTRQVGAVPLAALEQLLQH